MAAITSVVFFILVCIAVTISIGTMTQTQEWQNAIGSGKTISNGKDTLHSLIEYVSIINN